MNHTDISKEEIISGKRLLFTPYIGGEEPAILDAVERPLANQVCFDVKPAGFKMAEVRSRVK